MGRQDTSNSGAGRNGSAKTAGQRTAPGKSVPRGGRKPSPAVYRRRRLFAGVALLLVLCLIVGGVATLTSLLGGAQQASSAQDSAQGASTDGAEAGQPGATPSASPSATPSASPTCDQKLVTVKATTNKTSYAAD